MGLHCGDNLPFLRAMPGGSAHVVYLDPPFNTGRAWGGAEGFGDTWRWDDGSEAAYAALTAGDSALAALFRALRSFRGECSLMAYLTMMAPRLVELRRVLRFRGFLYLHCDPTISSYLACVCTAIFGPKNFRNSIAWKRTSAHGSNARSLGRIHDTILVYARARKAVLRAPVDDLWTDIKPLNAQGRERTGYPTQKPMALLERIILASSDPGDVVLDPFCGSGTTLEAAARTGRRWIGMDMNQAAIAIAERRMAGYLSMEEAS